MMSAKVEELWAKVERLEEELEAVRQELERLQPGREDVRLLPSMRVILEECGVPEAIKPIPAEQLQQMMLESGINPEDNLFSRTVIEAREE